MLFMLFSSKSEALSCPTGSRRSLPRTRVPWAMQGPASSELPDCFRCAGNVGGRVAGAVGGGWDPPAKMPALLSQAPRSRQAWVDPLPPAKEGNVIIHLVSSERTKGVLFDILLL